MEHNAICRMPFLPSAAFLRIVLLICFPRYWYFCMVFKCYAYATFISATSKYLFAMPKMLLMFCLSLPMTIALVPESLQWTMIVPFFFKQVLHLFYVDSVFSYGLAHLVFFNNEQNPVADYAVLDCSTGR